MSSSVVTTPKDKPEILGERFFDAPRELVFDAFTNVNHISNWWGPHGFTTTTKEHDLRPGGVWRFVMHGPDGTDYPNKVVFREVDRPSRLVYDHTGDDDADDIRFHVIVSFDEIQGKTRLTMRMIFESIPRRDELAEWGAKDGLVDTLDRFAEQLTAGV